MAKRIIPMVTKFGHKDEPYYRGEFDQQNERERILNYTAKEITDEWNKHNDLKCGLKEKATTYTVDGLTFLNPALLSQKD